jgi:hypothetical protein
MKAPAGKAAPAWQRLVADAASKLRRAGQFVLRNYNDFFTKLPWAVVIVIIVAITIRGLTERVTVIRSLSVPQALADSGYTPEVAGDRLRDALTEFIDAANLRMHSPEMALPGELPDVVVPSVGISLDAIMASVRTLLGITRSRTITGEFTVAGGRLWLRLRIDGRELYTSGEGVDPERPDDLLKTAAPAVLSEIKPYIVASSLASSDPAQALDRIDAIISQYPESDDNVVWAYNLRGYIYLKQKDYAHAIEALNKAIRLDGHIATFHVKIWVVSSTTRAITTRRSPNIAAPSRTIRRMRLPTTIWALRSAISAGAARPSPNIARPSGSIRAIPDFTTISALRCTILASATRPSRNAARRSSWIRRMSLRSTISASCSKTPENPTRPSRTIARRSQSIRAIFRHTKISATPCAPRA